MSVGYSGTPLTKKLGIKEGHRVATVGAPPHFPDLLDPLPGSVRLRSDLRAKGDYDVLVAFARTERELRERFDRASSESSAMSELARAYSDFVRSSARLKEQYRPGGRAELDEGERAQLCSLGYIDCE